ncbi:hypothetical protein L202_04336 [Cryptococcus amylolentus CBS 6039]|uniref:Uncharacterized protein n=2 Tax=Cryptococcus amylolentus TaxID=104669 RepID=A0A1E3HQZ1_9TREE|nr:hypothetical protein L202_04336 [Cryptococcus amylolentus CBS 6039]ODN78778.1 hypothetical protein L202_04336 [Cryptococcus amylolentus CBS 6039]ODO06724.1 hypothetical protein I350_04083 [Cryptococcus amylolentus CBS 6273]
MFFKVVYVSPSGLGSPFKGARNCLKLIDRSNKQLSNVFDQRVVQLIFAFAVLDKEGPSNFDTAIFQPFNQRVEVTNNLYSIARRAFEDDGIVYDQKAIHLRTMTCVTVAGSTDIMVATSIA